MAEPIVDPIVEPTPPVVEPITEPAEPPKTFTQEDLNRVGAKEKKQGEAAILKELGLTSKEEIASFKEQMAAFKAEQEKKLTVEDKLKSYEEQLGKYKADYETALAEKEQAKQEAWIAKSGVPGDKADFYLFKINKMMAADDIDFAAAATQYLKENPIEQPAPNKPASLPPMWGGKAKPLENLTKEDLSKMTYMEKVELKSKQPDLFAQLTKKEK